MEITTELTEQDHTDFYKEYGFKRNWLQKSLIILLIDLIICAWFGALVIQLVIVFAILLFPFFFVIPYYLSRRTFIKAYTNDLYPISKRIYKPFAIGIEIVDEAGESFLRYTDIKKVGKTINYVFIILFDNSYYLLPNWNFSSYPEIDHFLRVIESGRANAKGIRPSESFTFKPGYLVGLICLIPLIGAFAGIVLVILGLVHYKDKVFVIMGAIGITITVVLYGSLIYTSQNTDVFKNGFADITQTQINDLVKSIEFYKMQNGNYPDSLQQIETKGSFISIYDTMSEMKMGSKATTYQYHKVGNKYFLFSVGVDGKANTRDDIYPTLSVADTSKLGYIRKKSN